MMSRCIVLLGKEPIAGQVKTRLAKDIGFERAAEIQHQLTLECIRVLQPLRVPIIFQMSGNVDGAYANIYTALGAFVEAQATGTLSRKIFYASQRAQRTIIVGTDMPLFNIREIERALLESKLVIGPSQDGGYWIIGGNRIPADILNEIPWSTKQVYEKTIAKCQQLGLEYKVLSCQYDIDTESDLSLLLQDPRCPQHLKHSILDILENTNFPQN